MLGDYLLDSWFLNSSTGMINLHFLQYRISLPTIPRISVDILPQYNEEELHWGQLANKLFIPNSFLKFIKLLLNCPILGRSRNYTSA